MQPFGGFPEPFRSDVIGSRERVDGRPGEALPPADFAAVRKELKKKFGSSIRYHCVFPNVQFIVGKVVSLQFSSILISPFQCFRDVDVLSAVLYPQVFDGYMKHVQSFGTIRCMAGY